jgi:hypothetical protein
MSSGPVQGSTGIVLDRKRDPQDAGTGVVLTDPDGTRAQFDQVFQPLPGDGKRVDADQALPGRISSV